MSQRALQESRLKKMKWLAGVWRAFPVGTAITVVTSDEPGYIGQEGTVVGYDFGDRGSWPLVMVKLNSGITDGFYDDEEIRKSGLGQALTAGSTGVTV